MVFTICSLVLMNIADAMTIYGGEDIEKIRIVPVAQGSGEQKRYVIEDKNAVNYIIWLFSNMKSYEDTDVYVFDVPFTYYSFTNADEDVLCEFKFDALCNIYYTIPTWSIERDYCYYDVDEALYVAEKIAAICDGETVIEDDIMLGPSYWSKKLIQIAIDKNLIPKLNRIGYQTSITRLDACEIAESFLLDRMHDNDIVSYYGKFYNDITTRDSYASQRLEEEMTTAEGEKYPEMKQIKQDNVFDDCDRRSVVALRALDIIDGKDDENFYPYDTVTREEMAKVLSNLWHYINEDSVIDVQESSYNDSEEISEWAKVYVDEMSTIGILKGDDNGNFAPQRHMTKEEVIVALLRLFEINNK